MSFSSWRYSCELFEQFPLRNRELAALFAVLREIARRICVTAKSQQRQPPVEVRVEELRFKLQRAVEIGYRFFRPILCRTHNPAMSIRIGECRVQLHGVIQIDERLLQLTLLQPGASAIAEIGGGKGRAGDGAIEIG